jgi:hypothetical protein
MVDLPWVQLLWSKYYSNGKVPGQRPKGSYWWRSILKLLNTYKGVAQAQFGSSDTILFWTDMWNGRVLQLSFPQLFLFAKKEDITVAAVLALDNVQDVFQLTFIIGGFCTIL